MTVIDVTTMRARRQRRHADVMLGALIRVCDDDSGSSFHEGQVIAIERMCGDRGVGECLRVLVTRRVVDNAEQALPPGGVLLVDDAIPMHRVRSLRLRQQA